MKITKWVTYVLAQINFKVTDVLAVLGNRCLGSSQIIFKSHNSIVSGERVYNTFQSIINTPNWAINDNLSADGPGSSSVTIETDKNRCTILWSQHAWIDEKTEEHKQSSDIEMIIQCSSK